MIPYLRNSCLPVGSGLQSELKVLSWRCAPLAVMADWKRSRSGSCCACHASRDPTTVEGATDPCVFPDGTIPIGHGRATDGHGMSALVGRRTYRRVQCKRSYFVWRLSAGCAFRWMRGCRPSILFVLAVAQGGVPCRRRVTLRAAPRSSRADMRRRRGSQTSGAHVVLEVAKARSSPGRSNPRHMHAAYPLATLLLQRGPPES